MRSVLVRAPSPARRTRPRGTWLLAAGIAAFAVALGGYAAYGLIHPESWTLNMIDLSVYRSGGLIVRHVHGYYNPQLATPLYDWTRNGKDSLKFTYTPFAAIVFAVISFIPYGGAKVLSVGVNIIALMAAIWFALGGLGYRNDRVRAGAMLLGAAVVFWTEPVIRTLYLGQVNLVLMALILWDLCQPDARRNKGFATGIAAGIKLVPLIFIPYLLITRKFRQAAMACAGFAFTVLFGLAILPRDSSKWWFGGLFAQGGRTGFVGWEGNQSLDGIITRLSGSINGAKPAWLAAAVIVTVLGIVAAGLLYRAGHALPALLLTALTGDLVSPISWDHHWVWVAPATVVAGHYAVTAWRAGRKRAAWGLGAGAAAIVALFTAWPGALWGERMTNRETFFLGIIWDPPNSNPFQTYYKFGDQPWYDEYRWHGFQLLTGNAYVLGGLAAFLALLLVAILLPRPAAPAAGVNVTSPPL